LQQTDFHIYCAFVSVVIYTRPPAVGGPNWTVVRFVQCDRRLRARLVMGQRRSHSNKEEERNR